MTARGVPRPVYGAFCRFCGRHHHDDNLTIAHSSRIWRYKMKPIETRIEEYTTLTPVETTTVEVYNRVLWVLAEEKRLLEEAIWAPRMSPKKTEAMRVRRDCLGELTVLIEALKSRHLGEPIKRHRRTMAPVPAGPLTGYAEP